MKNEEKCVFDFDDFILGIFYEVLCLLNSVTSRNCFNLILEWAPELFGKELKHFQGFHYEGGNVLLPAVDRRLVSQWPVEIERVESSEGHGYTCQHVWACKVDDEDVPVTMPKIYKIN